jgi:biopolymer transport protein ExbB/TolQ
MSLPVTDAVHAAASVAASGAVSFDLVSMWHAMGLLARMVAATLGAMSIYSLAVMAERLLTYARATRASRQFALQLRELLPADKYDEAIALAKRYHRGHLARVMCPALAEYQMAHGAKGEVAGPIYDVMAAVNRAIERNSLRVSAELRRGLGGLATISSAAPFVGLLGTVGGIITAFQSMAATGSGGLGSVSAGIAEALVTTAFGLFVAIPAVMMFNYFTHRVEDMQVDMTESACELVDFLTKRVQALGPSNGKGRPAKSSWSDSDIPDEPTASRASSLAE